MDLNVNFMFKMPDDITVEKYGFPLFFHVHSKNDQRDKPIARTYDLVLRGKSGEITKFEMRISLDANLFYTDPQPVHDFILSKYKDPAKSQCNYLFRLLGVR